MPFISDQIFVIALNVMKVAAYKMILYYIRESGISDLLFYQRDFRFCIVCNLSQWSFFFFFFSYWAVFYFL